MAFNRYRWQIYLRVTFLTLTAFAFAFSFQLQGYWFLKINLGVLLILQVYMMIQLLTRWMKDLKTFHSAIRHGDYSISYQSISESDPFAELYEILNHTARFVRKVKSEHVQQNQYFRHVVENSQVGMVAYDSQGTIILHNDEALKLSGSMLLRSLHELEGHNPELYAEVKALELNKPKLIVLKNNGRVKLSARLSEFIIEEKSVFLLTLLNIRPELEENELQSWQELISVLTHEIMNSITPINSLAGSMEKYFARIEGNEDAVAKARNSLEVIQRRSAALMNFVDRYRTISTVPLPQLQDVKAGALVSHVLTLLEQELTGIEVKVEDNGSHLYVDAAQFEQVLINLLRNAVYSLEDKEDKRISIRVSSNATTIEIAITDSGRGIAPELMEKIFIPFFTTRRGGSGIGLTLSRQIIQRHGGNISVRSQPGKGSTFIISLKKS